MSFGITYSFTPTPENNHKEITALWRNVHKAEEVIKEIQNRKEDNMDWKDLDINNIPNDFFSNDNYVLEMIDELTFDKKVNVVKNMKNYNTKYRYRLKPLEPIRVTKKEKHNLTFTVTHLNKILKGEYFTKEHLSNAINASIKGIEEILDRVEIID